MKLVVGLGNPGREYKNTRHNVGFSVIDNYLGKVDWKTKMKSYFYSTDVNGEQVIFIKPLTYMNLSGLAVSKVVNFYKIDMTDILNSSSGGHNGIKSIISELNSEEFGRLKVGIGHNRLMPTDKYVLAKIPKTELNEITKNYDIFNEIIDEFIKSGIDKVIENYNKK